MKGVSISLAEGKTATYVRADGVVVEGESEVIAVFSWLG